MKINESKNSVKKYIIGLLLFTTFASIAQNDLPQVAFANSQIAIYNKSLGYQFEYILDSENLIEQAYKIAVDNKNVKIFGGDARGLLYGGLEAAEQLELYQKLSPAEGKPFQKQRGVKFNIPLDARTPSYDDTGDAAQNNILEMWNWNFWSEYLDKMAINRYNVITFWNPHPFPSMIKSEKYPDVALDDVFVTTLKPIGIENEWAEPQLVSSNVLENLKLVKKISIDDKIAFWQKLMQYANDRGIDVYFITWNICPNSVAKAVKPFYRTYNIKLWDEPLGKHGISHQINNQAGIDYQRDAVKEFLLTYPLLKGIGVTAGEHMNQDTLGWNRERWLWETYGEGILDAKKMQPERKVNFIHRVWNSNMDLIMKYWDQYPDNFDVSFKYAKARLFSSPDIPFADEHVEQMKKYGLKSWWNLRNDDIFVFRWGNPEYVRQFIKNFPPENTTGYYVGSDGYVWGKEFISKHEELSGELEINKHWYNFMLWGRLGYDNELSDTFFKSKIAKRHANLPSTELYETWKTASKIIPLVNVFHWRDWDFMFSAESGLGKADTASFRTVIDFMNNPTMLGQNIQSPMEYAKSEKNIGKTPFSVAADLHNWADATLKSVAFLKLKAKTTEEKVLLDDLSSMALLGKYYAEKIKSATYLAVYAIQKTEKNKTKAIKEATAALGYWNLYAELSSSNYKPQMMARTNLMDWKKISEDVAKDIDLVKEF